MRKIILSIIIVLPFLSSCNIPTIKNYDEAKSNKKHDAITYYNQGYAFAKQGQYQQAIDEFNEAIHLQPDNFKAYNSRGSAYNNLGKSQRAVADYNEAIRLKPDYADAYHNRGAAYASIGQYQLAIEDFSEAIHLKPKDAIFYNDRGSTFLYLAEHQHDEDSRLEPEFAQSYYSRKTFSGVKIGYIQQAIADFNEAVRLKPNYADAYNNRGSIYLLQGKEEVGCRDLRKACELGNCNALKSYKSQGICR